MTAIVHVITDLVAKATARLQALLICWINSIASVGSEHGDLNSASLRNRAHEAK
jgi:hypothetical protein